MPVQVDTIRPKQNLLNLTISYGLPLNFNKILKCADKDIVEVTAELFAILLTGERILSL